MQEKTILPEAGNFIEQIINEDIAAGKLRPEQVQTRFPPEPNGYLHIGHAKSMFVNFGTALKYGGKCNLFFDDTNPSKEKTEFVDAIRADIRWLGYEWARECYASDFFEPIYEYALRLIREGKARVRVLSTSERWFGVTYPGDMEAVRAAIAAKKASGEYPVQLWK